MRRTTMVRLGVLGLALAAVTGLAAFGAIGTGDGREPLAVSSALANLEPGPAEPDEWFLAQRNAADASTALTDDERRRGGRHDDCVVPRCEAAPRSGYARSGSCSSVGGLR
jgi:hypothetical protein